MLHDFQSETDEQKEEKLDNVRKKLKKSTDSHEVGKQDKENDGETSTADAKKTKMCGSVTSCHQHFLFFCVILTFLMLTWWCLCHICREELKKESRRLLKELKGSKKESAKEETEKKNSGQCKLHVTRHLDFIAQARFLFAPIGTDMFAVVASDEESAEESNELVADFKAQRKKYEKKQKFIGKKGSDRETATLDMLAKFQVRKNDVVRHIFFQELSASHWNRASEILPLQHSMRRPPCYVTLSIDVQNVWHVLACDCTSKKYRTALAQCVWCGVVLLCLQLSGTRPKVTNRPSRRDTTSSAFWCHVTMCSGHSCAAFAVGNL